MIKAKDLMIGDYVLERNGFPMKVVSIYDDVVYLDFDGNEGDVWEEEEKNLTPLPISDELLADLGFVKLMNDRFLFYPIELEKIGTDYVLLLPKTETVVGTKLVGLHHLQNIYKIVVGKDLEVNLQ